MQDKDKPKEFTIFNEKGNIKEEVTNGSILDDNGNLKQFVKDIVLANASEQVSPTIILFPRAMIKQLEDKK